jgi:hypothetical protein
VSSLDGDWVSRRFGEAETYLAAAEVSIRDPRSSTERSAGLCELAGCAAAEALLVSRTDYRPGRESARGLAKLLEDAAPVDGRRLADLLSITTYCGSADLELRLSMEQTAFDLAVSLVELAVRTCRETQGGAGFLV